MADALAQARAKKKSVLDFLQSDLTRMSDRGPASQKPKLDAHADAIRQLERQLDYHSTSVAAFRRQLHPSSRPTSTPNTSR